MRVHLLLLLLALAVPSAALLAPAPAFGLRAVGTDGDRGFRVRSACGVQRQSVRTSVAVRAAPESSSAAAGAADEQLKDKIATFYDQSSPLW